MMPFAFNAPSDDKSELEDAGDFTPRFDDRGLITAIVTDATDGELLMVAHMNAQALALTIQTGKAHYFSRSRGKLWIKGETSGNTQMVKEIRTDCDQDAIWLKVEVAGHDATCHTGRRSCFYRTVNLEDGKPMLDIVDDELQFDPNEVYGKET
ncbi:MULTISPECIES: phosphoribosyl-AMP cyclohydrolase [Rhizobium]|uniref:Phosphoribosyl-AMP cyclohydrolase n=1 Tax=Rhizobium favelukesii TaxID=348824 RepID=W6R9Z2_9HYPH|nr:MULTISPECIES: phosphoribosyl-AMP cyclohydrolase [Rhizobium]MCA0801939.1 phosphoribosyl-AMP cyclohydrolase [Rhizobium sp. T1473]MCS0461980.1 phosphoribosyl-AMP cyclohydrolase [Rhizobium favelukesii]UFS84278.1 phosphoribosyl-AMP cyclohydrolase [Rhizobium sp. T136]CDM58052.1 phosphoribosyl-AMP cyclohydrolase [Rhizobium favelukesii]